MGRIGKGNAIPFTRGQGKPPLVQIFPNSKVSSLFAKCVGLYRLAKGEIPHNPAHHSRRHEPAAVPYRCNCRPDKHPDWEGRILAAHWPAQSRLNIQMTEKTRLLRWTFCSCNGTGHVHWITLKRRNEIIQGNLTERRSPVLHSVQCFACEGGRPHSPYRYVPSMPRQIPPN